MSDVKGAIAHPFDNVNLAGATVLDLITEELGIPTDYAAQVYARTQLDWGDTTDPQVLYDRAAAVEKSQGALALGAKAADGVSHDYQDAVDAIPSPSTAAAVVFAVLLAIAFIYGLGKGVFK